MEGAPNVWTEHHWAHTTFQSLLILLGRTPERACPGTKSVSWRLIIMHWHWHVCCPQQSATTHPIRLSGPSQRRCRQAWEPNRAVAASAAVRGSGRGRFPQLDSSCSKSCCLPLAPDFGPACARLTLLLLRAPSGTQGNSVSVYLNIKGL